MPFQREVFLVDDNLIGEYYVQLGKRGFLKHVEIEAVLADETGLPGAHFVRVIVSEQMSLAIRDQEVQANRFGVNAKVQKTEFAIQPIDPFLGASGAGSEAEAGEE